MPPRVEGEISIKVSEAVAALKKAQAEAMSSVDAMQFLGEATGVAGQAMYDQATAARRLEAAQEALASNDLPEAQSALAQEVLKARSAVEKADDSVEKLGDETETAGKKSEGFVDRFEKDMRGLKDTIEVGQFAMQGLGQAIEIVSASAERLGRSEFNDALDRADVSSKRLTDSLLEIPIGRLIPAFQIFGDKTLKNADAITILTRAFDAASDGMNTVSAAGIYLQAQLGNITWEEAAQQVQELNGELEATPTAAQKAGQSISAYAARWAGLATEIQKGNAAGENVKQWLALREAEEGAAHLSIMADVATTLAAGLSGAVSQAQDTYTQAMADSNTEIVKLQDEIANTDKNSRDYATTIGVLNDAIGVQSQKQVEAAAALRAANAEFVFQIAMAHLDEQGQLALAFSMGKIDEKSYNASLRVITLTETYDKNHDGIVSLDEEQDKYIHGLNYVAQTADGTTTPAMNDYKASLNDAETAMGTAYTKAGDLKGGLDQLQGKTIVIETVFKETRTSSGGSSGNQVYYADGGPVSTGQQVVWNEDPATRPETFVAGKPGYILTKQDAQAALAGGGGGATYTINIDARGALDPAAVEAAGYRGAKRALAEISRTADARLRNS